MSETATTRKSLRFWSYRLLPVVALAFLFYFTSPIAQDPARNGKPLPIAC